MSGGEIPRTRIGGMVFVASRGFRMVLFSEPSDNLCWRFMRSTECTSSFSICFVHKGRAVSQDMSW